MESIPGKHLLAELGLAPPDLPSDILNEAHHMTDDLVTGPHGEVYLYVAGLISANIFRCDVADPLHISPCQLVVDTRKVRNFAGTDDLKILPNGNLIATYMGSKGLTTPGGLVEFTPDGTVVAEYAAAKAGGPVRYRPGVTGQMDTGLLAHPHGIDLRPDLDLLITSDYADPLSLATSTPTDQHQDLGTTVRMWQLSNLAGGPQKIIQMPDGPRVEPNPIHEEPEGLMQVVLTRQPHHKGTFVASMCGGAIFYTPDITVPHPPFREVSDFGPCTGASVFILTSDDRFLIVPVAGVQSPGDPVFERDYAGEHTRRVAVLDLQALLQARHKVQCGPPTVIQDSQGYTASFMGPNNGAADCPILAGVVHVDSQKNFATHGGPHFVVLDQHERRMAFSNYFVDLNSFGLPGTGSGGDDKICMATLLSDGQVALDGRFRDELTDTVCVDFDRPTSYHWPNRGTTGHAKPHAMIFIHRNH
jgi:hypothetical protein